MKKIAGLLMAGTLALGLALPAQAATVSLGTVTHLYGNGPGQVDPSGNDTLSATGVLVSDQSTNRFADLFDFSALVHSTIDRIALTLNFSGAGPSILPGELWSARIQGGDATSSIDDTYRPLIDGAPRTFVFSAATDIFGANAFATSVANKTLGLWFAESTFGSDRFWLQSASLEVFGEEKPANPAAVPLPAGGLLLIGALGGLTAMRRRKHSA